MKISLLDSEHYRPSSVIDMRLRQPKKGKGGRASQPILTGYVIISPEVVQMMAHEGGEIFMTVAIWDNPKAPEEEKYPYTGKLEIREPKDTDEVVTRDITPYTGDSKWL
jgi:hypothetical protein